MRRGDAGGLALAAFFGASVWISSGSVAVIDEGGTRIGTLPEPWIGGVAAALAALIGVLARLRFASATPLGLCAFLWLPWLPMRVPAAFLLWEGPLESLIWAAAVCGLLISQTRARLGAPKWLIDPRLAPRVAVAALVVPSLAAAMVLARQLPAGDEPQYLVITQSLLRDGDLRIENNHERGDYLQYYPDGLDPDFLQRGRDGQIYSIHAAGLPLLVLPAFAIGGYPGVVIILTFLCASAFALIWKSARELTASASAAWAGWVAVAGSATMFFHTFAVFPDGFGAALMAVVVWWLVTDAVAPEHARSPATVGVALAIMPWLHTRFAVVAGIAGAIIVGRLMHRPDRWRQLAAFLVVPLVSAACWFSYFWVIYGTPDPTFPYGTSTQSALAWIGRGLIGLLFDQQYGIVAAAPVMALVPYGFYRLAQQRPRLAIELLAIAVPYFLVVAAFGMWWGGHSAPARFLTCGLPIAVIALAFTWRDATAALRLTMLLFIAIGLGNVAARTALEDGALLFNFRDGYDLLLDRVSATVNVPLAMPSVHRDGPVVALGAALIWLGAAVAAGILLHSALRRFRPSAASTWTITTAAFAITASVAATLCWSARPDRVPLTPASSMLSVIERWNPARETQAIELPAMRRLEAYAAISRFAIPSDSRRPQPVDRPLLTLTRVPPANYRIRIEGTTPLDGSLSLTIGSSPLPLRTWRLKDIGPGETMLTAALGAGAASLAIHADAIAAQRISRISLRPQIIEGRESPALAVRATSYGDSHVYFLDAETFMEADGFWTRADSHARVYMELGNWPPGFDLQSGPTATDVVISAERWSEEYRLAAHERRHVQIPFGPAVVEIRTVGGFRPRDVDPTSKDGRRLGVRVEIPPRGKSPVLGS